VTQILNLLKLIPEVQERVIGLGDPLPPGAVTERSLRGIVQLPLKRQNEAVRKTFEEMGEVALATRPNAKRIT
jgi:hypothetical protein